MDAAAGQPDLVPEDGTGESPIESSDVELPWLGARIDAPSEANVAEAGTQFEVATPDGEINVWPVEIPSRQSVRFTVDTQRMGWAITQADRCSAFGINRQTPDGTWQALVLGIPYQCGCECPAPPDFGELQSLASPPTVTWDARELAVVTAIQKCPTIPPQTQDITVLHATPQPVAPGHYRVSLGVYDTLPQGCTERVDTGWALCSDFSISTSQTFSNYKACSADRTAKAEFDLPESGNIEVRLLVD